MFSFGRHDHNHEHPRPDAEKFIETLKGGGDRGSRITLIGLFANIALTAAKGTAGWFFHSAALLAEAGHSLSDLLGDLATLFYWKISRRPNSARYPYGYGKYETLGTVSVSLFLVGGALGIGFHSYNLLLEALYPTIQTLSPGLAHDIIQTIVQSTSHIASHGEHLHDHEHALDPNAAWFAAISVIAKEWLYRATKKVADDENSGVLMANAIHHRSDAWSSLVALVAIVGTWLVPGLPLDPLGGLVVSFVILGQGMGLLRGGFDQLMDRGISEKTRMSIVRQLNPLFNPSSPSLQLKHLTAIRDVRAVRSGAHMFVDLVAILPPQTTMVEAYFVQEQINKRLVSFKKEISEVRIKMIPEQQPGSVEENKS
ncbi:hypothetical protein Clacol_000767 [Clathrus columnatus]|uniref:Cation efflux protein transmembrane domain-containing protein n=1 Tax=Clathrus columnatus TaxID=1419009 RepID=A0AAV4ZZX1_9AGAM|nr:hypothetical protein Clacol_000767 [Clathrus columnatus]